MRAALIQECLAIREGIEAVAARLAQGLAGVPGADTLPAIAAALVDPLAFVEGFASPSQSDQPYLDALLWLRVVIDWRACVVRPEAMRTCLVSPASDDALVETEPLAGWGPVAILVHVALGLVRPRRKAAVVVTLRDDGVSALEWIAHARAIGFEGIFIYTNDNADGSDPLLHALAEQGVITLIENETAGRVSPQRKAFAHSLHFLPELRDFEWVFYADSDEFLVPAAAFGRSVPGMLAALEQRYAGHLPSAVCFHWRWFVSAYAMARTEGILLQRFQHAKPAPPLVKSMVRLCDVVSMRVLHFPEVLPGGYFVDAALDMIEASRGPDKAGVWEYRNDAYRGGELRHYWCKSFEEFLVKKRRGDQLRMPAEHNDYRREMHLFFEWNAPEDAASLAPPPAELVQRLLQDLAWLRSLDGIPALEQATQDGFRHLVQDALAGQDLPAAYDAVLRQTKGG